MSARPSSNFDFLAYHDPRLVVLGAEAERLFAEFPVACISTLRLFGEVLAQRAAAKVGVYVDARDGQAEVLARLAERGVLPYAPRELFHDLRRRGNDAAHEGIGDHREALHQLKQARELGIWFQRSFGNNRKFDPGPFVPPAAPTAGGAEVTAQLDALRAALEKSEIDRTAVQAAVEAEAQKRQTAEQRAEQLAEERALWEALAEEAETKRALDEKSVQAKIDAAIAEVTAKHAAELASLQAHAVAAPPEAVQASVDQAAEAGSHVDLDEAATRRLIDAQLRAAGWEVDSESLTQASGARPQKGVNRAIAEWRIGPGGAASDRADYVLFVGLDAYAVTQSSARLRPPDWMSSEYLKLCLQSPLLTRQYDKYRFGNAVQRLNVEHVRCLAIPVAPDQERTQVVEAAGRALSKAPADAVISASRWLGGLDQGILARAFAGGLLAPGESRVDRHTQVAMADGRARSGGRPPL